MSKILKNEKKLNSIKKPNVGKEFIILDRNPENYKLVDIRAMKPFVYQDLVDPNKNMILQEVDNIEFKTKINGKENKLSYYVPNNVGILLSISNKALDRAKKIYDEQLNPDKYNHILGSEHNRGEDVRTKSLIVYDFIEEIQTSIVFGYTAIEAFTNLSIYADYKYENVTNKKGITETYDKEAIERWLPLNKKISEILVDIYKCKSIQGEKIWTKFKKFEEFRNEIIHQKSIKTTTLYKEYFKKTFFEMCTIPEKIIKFFFDERENKKSTNSLWPWIINSSNEFPITRINPEELIKTGNIYEGRE